MSSVAEAAIQLESAFGLSGPELRYGLTQDELFHEAIANDRGRVEPGGPLDAQKAFPTSLGVDGPLVYFTDPDCTGRPVSDTFCVNRDSVTDSVWWKNGFAKFEPSKFDELLPRVIAHLNEAGQPPLCHRCVLRVGHHVRRAVSLRRGVRDPRLLLQHHVSPRPSATMTTAPMHGWTLINVPSFDMRSLSATAPGPAAR